MIRDGEAEAFHTFLPLPRLPWVASANYMYMIPRRSFWMVGNDRLDTFAFAFARSRGRLS